MKLKKLVIIGALSIAVSAQAQSNVSIYGIVDTGIQSYNNGTDRFTRSINGGLNTSRLGFKGTEDLGGGLKANFVLESQINPSTGSVGSTTVATNEVFNREAWVGLSGGFGEIRVGRTDVTGAQDIDAYVSQAGNLALRPTNGTGVELGSNQKNIIRYITPTMYGLTVDVGHASGNSAGTTADAQASQSGINLTYQFNKLKLFAGYQKNDATSTVGQRDFTAYGASYDFGVVSTGLSYAQGDASTIDGQKNTSTVASVKMPLANGYAVHGVYATAKNGAQSSANTGKGYTLAVTKSLSKRTTLYAAYTDIDNEANAKMAMNNTTAPTTDGLGTKSILAGISHKF
jgi:predicted porin